MNQFSVKYYKEQTTEVADTRGGYLEKGHENASSDLKASISLEGPCKERIIITENPRAALKQEEIC